MADIIVKAAFNRAQEQNLVIDSADAVAAIVADDDALEALIDGVVANEDALTALVDGIVADEALVQAISDAIDALSAE
jgi:hypothetical protein